MYHRSLYQLSVRLSKHGYFYIPTAELYHSVKPLDGKLCIYERFHNKNETLRQAACNRMALKLIPDDLKD